MRKRSKAERIAAIAGIVLLVGIYVVTFIAAITANPHTQALFMGCLLCTVFVPIFLHILIRMFQMMAEKKEGSMTMHELHQQRKAAKREAAQNKNQGDREEEAGE